MESIIDQIFCEKEQDKIFLEEYERNWMEN